MTKTIRNDYLESRSQNKTYTFYTGDLESFAKNILQNGRGNGTVCLIGTIPPEISTDMTNKGIMLAENTIIVTQKEIFKYKHHPKTTKGANIPLDDYHLIEAAIRDPAHIYEDTMQKRLVYVCTHPYHTDKMVKVVVVPNFKEHGTVANRVKSWGQVEKNKMKMPQYKEIK